MSLPHSGNSLYSTFNSFAPCFFLFCSNLDIDECMSEVSPCHDNATCMDTTGSFQCQCDTGFLGNGLTCDPLCEQGTHNCPATASCAVINNVETCVCNPGYTGSGTVCNDVDECQLQQHNCSAMQLLQCENTEGAFRCICQQGSVATGVEATPCQSCEYSFFFFLRKKNRHITLSWR